jgi:uncharacterized membrane protein YcaP (DUF421 family)
MQAAAFDWSSILLPAVTWSEKAVRPLLVYLALLVVNRVGAKRALQQATVFDFLVLLLVSNIVQNAMIGNDNSILGALFGTAVVLLLSTLLNRAAAQSHAARNVLEGMPEMLVRSGVLDHAQMHRHGVARGDLLLAIRKQGISRIEDVAFAILELDGTISIIRRDADPRPHTALPDELAPMDPSGGASPRLATS